MNGFGKLMVGLVASAAFSFAGCVSGDGVGGDTPIDCGEHGSVHDGYCHCESGFLFDGTTCIAPDSISEVCEEHDADAGDPEHHHAACVCQSDPCPCDEGTVESIGGTDYCVPASHE